MRTATSVHTRFDADDDSGMSAAMMLAPDGTGSVMVASDGTPQFSVDAADVSALVRVLAECESFWVGAQPDNIEEASARVVPLRQH